MSEQVFYCAGQTEALAHSVKYLQENKVRFAERPDKTVTHLLLDVPCQNIGQLPQLLAMLPENVTVMGGNLPPDCNGIDLLQDPYYLSENANITAHCAVKLALSLLPVTLDLCPVLILGWGRIGKCLAKLLKQIGASVTVAARKEADRAMLTALGYDTLDFSQICKCNPRVVFNTVPSPVANSDIFSPECLKLELASSPGITGSDVVDARRLPGRYAPESSGALIARSILRLC